MTAAQRGGFVHSGNGDAAVKQLFHRDVVCSSSTERLTARGHCLRTSDGSSIGWRLLGNCLFATWRSRVDH